MDNICSGHCSYKRAGQSQEILAACGSELRMLRLVVHVKVP